jgi:xanthine/CO dehydrogenase XdhC/CoxF family maturation factor
VVYLLLERRTTAASLLTALEAAFKQRTPLAIATVLKGPHIAQRSFAGREDGAGSGTNAANDLIHIGLHNLAELAFGRGASIEKKLVIDGAETRAWADYRAARPGLWIFGAGDDAKPLVHLARELGWFAGVADGRSHLAARERFRAADVVNTLPIADLPGTAAVHLDLRPTDAAVVMTHSFEQDSRILASLLALEFPLAYLGVLGPQRRTSELLAEAARLLNLPHPTDCAERWLAQMHAPTGIDLGAETPATIALSIVAEIQQTIAAASAQPLRKVRAATTIATT